MGSTTEKHRRINKYKNNKTVVYGQENGRAGQGQLGWLSIILYIGYLWFHEHLWKNFIQKLSVILF